MSSLRPEFIVAIIAMLVAIPPAAVAIWACRRKRRPKAPDLENNSVYSPMLGTPAWNARRDLLPDRLDAPRPRRLSRGLLTGGGFTIRLDRLEVYVPAQGPGGHRGGLLEERAFAEGTADRTLVAEDINGSD